MDSYFGMVSAPSRVPAQPGPLPVAAAPTGPVMMRGDVYVRSGAGPVAAANAGGLGGAFQ
ncbi:MAG: hypothetical protein JWM80_5580, partial [Cyanobacteria bacterium RYN_339]|nr:hypothetical protein [Cyanobacteria bacterium RYN_339]